MLSNKCYLHHLFLGTRLLLRTTGSSHWPLPQQRSGGDTCSHGSHNWSQNYCRWTHTHAHVHMNYLVLSPDSVYLLFSRNGTSTVTDNTLPKKLNLIWCTLLTAYFYASNNMSANRSMHKLCTAMSACIIMKTYYYYFMTSPLIVLLSFDVLVET